jgi:hypothetical protein
LVIEIYKFYFTLSASLSWEAASGLYPVFAILQMLFFGNLNQAQTISDRKDQAHRFRIYEEPPPEFKEKEE